LKKQHKKDKIAPSKKRRGGEMGYKRWSESISFVDMAMRGSLEKNRSLRRMDRINQVIDWTKIEERLRDYYKIGRQEEGADAYPPLMLLKALLLQKWFRIVSDPELENQINDRSSFKIFLGLPLDGISPDHSTFSRFRSRLSNEAMAWINNEVLQQFARKGMTINEGIAIDARLIESASHPLSNDELKKEQEKRDTPEGQVDKNGKPLKFSRDLESDWMTKDGDPPFYGLKEHASVDVNNGLLLATELTPASHHESPYLPLCAAASCHTEEPIKIIYADKGYFGEPNRSFLSLNQIKDGIMRKDTTTAKLTEYEHERNKKISKKRYIVEQYFGLSHLHQGAQRARFTTIIKNAIDARIRQMAFNLFRGAKIILAT
jgi:IS5 family transposase